MRLNVSSMLLRWNRVLDYRHGAASPAVQSEPDALPERVKFDGLRQDAENERPANEPRGRTCASSARRTRPRADGLRDPDHRRLPTRRGRGPGDHAASLAQV